ncbi:MAG: hypothetical protein KBA51_03365 [Kiritimatiellae bacterium]|nr:hypothetical protein [Kiritimatiellia bacterium]
MKSSLWKIGWALAAFGASMAMAEEPAAAPAAAPAAEGSIDVQLDLGSDGRVTREEFLQMNSGAPGDVLQQAFAQLDANHDGAIAMDDLSLLGQAGPPPSSSLKPGPSALAPDLEPEGEIPLPEIPEAAAAAAKDCPYAVVISSTAASMPEWKAVADALVKKRSGTLVVYEGSVVNCLPELARRRPRYTAFVVRPEAAGRIIVARIHRLTRALNQDPYTDTLWGIISAATPEGAMRMALADEPKVLRRAISLTGINHGLFDQALTISDAAMGEWTLKKSGGAEEKGADGRADRTQMFVEHFNTMKPDLLVGSGHATERNLEMSFSRGNTEIQDGKWVGLVNWRTPSQSVLPIEPGNHPRVFLGAGNCLIGNFQNRADSMAAVLIDRYGFNQFVGYTVPTWYGKGGWGTLGIWGQMPGIYSLAEAWFFNNQAITEELIRRFPDSASRSLPVSERGEGLNYGLIARQDKDESGMLWDRDVVAFYGDPAHRVFLDGSKQPPGVGFRLRSEQTRHALDVAIAPECKVTGGWLALYFSKRIPGRIEVISGAEYEPLITENFIVLRKADYTPGKKYTVVFTATP